jgi:hypothetical protein
MLAKYSFIYDQAHQLCSCALLSSFAAEHTNGLSLKYLLPIDSEIACWPAAELPLDVHISGGGYTIVGLVERRETICVAKYPIKNGALTPRPRVDA